jgi:hypothetical protein
MTTSVGSPISLPIPGNPCRRFGVSRVLSMRTELRSTGDVVSIWKPFHLFEPTGVSSRCQCSKDTQTHVSRHRCCLSIGSLSHYPVELIHGRFSLFPVSARMQTNSRKCPGCCMTSIEALSACLNYPCGRVSSRCRCKQGWANSRKCPQDVKQHQWAYLTTLFELIHTGVSVGVGISGDGQTHASVRRDVVA